MGFGGPVWHASICPRYSSVGAVLATAWEVADVELRGVGDATLGEWREIGHTAVHLRRRLTVAEMRQGGIVDVCDVRGTVEYVHRIERMFPVLPAAMRAIPIDQFP